jgi:hypothetical protein
MFVPEDVASEGEEEVPDTPGQTQLPLPYAPCYS